MQNVASGDVRGALLALLRRRSRKAELVSQLTSSLRRTSATTEEIERALANLESEGAVIVREEYCADPHLAGVDLRIVALVEPPCDMGQDAVAEALAHVDAIWRQWLGEYLSTHTCS